MTGQEENLLVPAADREIRILEASLPISPPTPDSPVIRDNHRQVVENFRTEPVPQDW